MMINAVGHGGKKTMFKALASPSFPNIAFRRPKAEILSLSRYLAKSDKFYILLMFLSPSVRSLSTSLGSLELRNDADDFGENIVGLAPGTIAGIVVLSVVFVFVIIVLCSLSRKRQNLVSPASPLSTNRNATPPTTTSPPTPIPSRRSLAGVVVNFASRGYPTPFIDQLFPLTNVTSSSFTPSNQTHVTGANPGE
ncbi:hypothetical protein NLI96_g4993 [Meripilus lineatus]|uniref:Uncharacterized protein n=1 Tax=Meripilus lineatus TaxID=2056292 RepID=A0AAD5YF62_9APHY|nr:hypothetical protein NLI96_g4993 [Physisporinus lineatus]